MIEIWQLPKRLRTKGKLLPRKKFNSQSGHHMTDPDEHVCANGAAHMDAWRIFQVGPLRYVAGRRVATDKDGVTTPVIRLDTANLAVLTLSGSVYLLVGPPKPGPASLELWAAYCKKFQIDEWQDVTDEIWNMHLGGRS